MISGVGSANVVGQFDVDVELSSEENL